MLNVLGHIVLHVLKQQQKCVCFPQISMLEVYVESLIDLLSEERHSEVEIRTQGRSVSLPGLTEVEVKTEEDIINVMETGGKSSHLTSNERNTER